MEIINYQYSDAWFQKIIMEHSIDKILSKPMLDQIECCLYQSGETIIHTGEKMLYYYFFINGRLKIYQTQSDGRNLLIRFYSTFDSLGEVELFGDRDSFCSVCTIYPSFIMRIPTEAVRENAVDHPPFLEYVIKSLAAKLTDADRNHAINLLYPVKNRLASYLVGHSVGETKVILQDTLQDISEFIGASYRQLHRAMNSLCDEGYIKKENNRIIILKYESLEILAGEIYAC